MNEFPWWYAVGGLALVGAAFALVFALGFALILGGMWYIGIPLLGALIGALIGAIAYVETLTLD